TCARATEAGMKRLVVLVFLLASVTASAHKPSDSYLTLERSAGGITGQWDIALRDLDNAIALDANGDGDITWGEVRARQNDIAAYALARLVVTSNGQACPLRVSEHLVDQHSDGAYAVLRFVGTCPEVGPALSIGYGLFFDLDPSHRGLLQFVDSGQTQSIIFSADVREQTLDAGSSRQQLAAYVREGVWHIWLGFDHVMFLLSLLLPAVLQRRAGAWLPLP